jgi:hypothetical protein
MLRHCHGALIYYTRVLKNEIVVLLSQRHKFLFTFDVLVALKLVKFVLQLYTTQCTSGQNRPS